MDSKAKALTMAIPRHEQLSLFDCPAYDAEMRASSVQSSTGKVLSFGRASQQREAERVSDILRFVRSDVEHLRVK